MKTGAIVWDATLEDYKNGYASTIAPLVVKDKVIVGVAGGEFGIRGFIDAYDAQDRQARVALLHDSRPGRAGQRHLGGRFVEDRRRRRLGHRRVRSRAEPALLRHRQSRARLSQREPRGRQPLQLPRSWRSTPTPASCAGTTSSRRTTCTTGTRREVPILADLTIAGQPRKVVMFANRNGFYYTLDRTNGSVIVAKPFVHDDVGEGDRTTTAGRCCMPGHTPDEKGEITCPDITGGTNFWPPTFDPSHAHVLRQRARSVHDLLRLEAGLQAGRTLHRRRRPARARARRCRCTARCARSIRRPASGSGSSSYLTPVDGGTADDRVGPDLQRRQRGQPAGARLAQRQAALAIPDGRRRCTARRRSPTCSTAGSTCSCPRARR